MGLKSVMTITTNHDSSGSIMILMGQPTIGLWESGGLPGDLKRGTSLSDPVRVCQGGLKSKITLCCILNSEKTFVSSRFFDVPLHQNGKATVKKTLCFYAIKK